jgi:hypothetical protein
MFQRLLKTYRKSILLCSMLCITGSACGKKGSPTPLSKVREMEQQQEKQQTGTAKPSAVDEAKGGGGVVF